MNDQPSRDAPAYAPILKAALFGVAGLAAQQGLAWTFATVPWVRAPDVAAALFVAFSVAWYVKGRLQDDALGHYRGLRTRLDRLQLEAQEINGLTRLTEFSRRLPLPFGGGWALRGDSAAVLVRELIARKPEVIVELGSGVSTLLAAQVVERLGRGRVYSVDHDEKWLSETRRLLEAAGVAQHVELVLAPLEEQTVGGRKAKWYRLPDTVTGLDPIDFLFVDGPPELETRDCALDALGDQLAHDGCVYFDDVDAPEMAGCLARVQAFGFGATARRLRVGDGVLLLSRA